MPGSCRLHNRFGPTGFREAVRRQPHGNIRGSPTRADTAASENSGARTRSVAVQL
jgi:hypothetical protein